MVLKNLPFPISSGRILDPFAGQRKWWKGLGTANVVFLDKFIINPGTIQGSVIALPFLNSVFDQIVADPPHFIRKSKFAPSCALGHFGQYFSRDQLREEWSFAGEEFWRVTKSNATMILKTIDGAKTVSQTCNNGDLEMFSNRWDKREEYRVRSRVPWSSAWTVYSFWKRRP